MGPTVLDPSMRIEPERLDPPPLPPLSELLSSPQAATPSARTAAEAMAAMSLDLDEVTESPLRSVAGKAPVLGLRRQSQRSAALLL
jgi:hypothetical protein